MATTTSGPLLRHWRQHRGISQQELALRAEVSQRHLSFVENGRSKASRELLSHLGHVLDLPLRERNALLRAGGFAPIHHETSFDAEDFAALRSAIDQLLARHNPYPALVIDRHHNIVGANDAALLLTTVIAEDSGALTDPLNVVTMVVHPEGLWPHLEQPERLAAVLATRLVQDAARFPDDGNIAALRDAALLAAGDTYQVDAPAELALTMRLRIGDLVLSFFTLLATVGGALDVTADELTVELYYPADAETEAFLRSGADGATLMIDSG